jgi:hypothetical protein
VMVSEIRTKCIEKKGVEVLTRRIKTIPTRKMIISMMLSSSRRAISPQRGSKEIRSGSIVRVAGGRAVVA